MNKVLLQKLNLAFSWNKSRIECFTQVIISLISLNAVSLKSLATGISGKALLTSKVQRVYRFLREQIFDYDLIAKFILSLFNADNYIIALDRTCWKFGKSDINILFLVIVVGRISVPIYWQMLNHGGACDSDLMKEILLRFTNNFGINKIKYLLGDREFMSLDWLKFLINNKITPAIPLKKDTQIREKGKLQKKRIDQSFNALACGQYTTINAILWDHKVTIAAHRNCKGELMAIVSLHETKEDIFSLYRYRWSIERLFFHFKSGGFNIEDSHITDISRFTKLIAICAIAGAIIVKNGVLQDSFRPIKIKRAQIKPTPAKSLFTYGLDNLKHAIIHYSKKTTESLFKMLFKPMQLNAFPLSFLKIVG